MKVKIKGIVGTILKMDCFQEFVRVCNGEVGRQVVTGYQVTILESPGKEIMFKYVTSDEIEVVTE